jgi:uncharacterized protein YnzC (UPF0291/DUF896 family)
MWLYSKILNPKRVEIGSSEKMGEDEVENKALRVKYLNEIAQELEAELQRKMKDEKGNILKTQVLRYIKFDENGKMHYDDSVAPQFAPSYIEQFQESKFLIEYLAVKLADAKMEYVVNNKKIEGLKTELTKAKEAINGVLEGLNDV